MVREEGRGDGEHKNDIQRRQSLIMSAVAAAAAGG